MAWNESGDGKNPRDPWSGGGDGPNDLDKIIRNWQRRLRGALGGKGGKGGGGSSPGGSSAGIGLIVVLALVAWGLTGLYRVDEAERGVVLRFGAYQDTTMPGLHWHIPFPVETVQKVNANEVSDFPYSTEMLTADLQYVNIDMVVQFRRADPVAYSFNVVDPELTLQDVTESALREVVGTTELEVLIAARREEIASRTREVLQATLDNYGAGIAVTSIALENVNYPDSVQAAVDDAQKARNDSDRYELEADAYARDVIPKAKGEAARVLEDAEAYRERVIADAQGDAARFEALLVEYQKAPRVTRERLYIDAIEEVYGRSKKVFLDSDSSGNLLYLPVDELLRQGSRPAPVDINRSADSPTPQQSRSDVRIEPVDPRERRVRE